MHNIPASNTLTYFRPLTLAYVRREGPLSVCIAEAWQELREHCASHGLDIDGSLASYALLHGPICHDMTSARYDACIELPAAMEQAVRGNLAIQLVSGGVYIGGAACKGHAHLASAFDALKSDPLITHDLVIDVERPAIITYARKPSTGGARTGWTLNLNVPLGWTTSTVRQAA